MALKKVTFQTLPLDGGKRIDQVLAERLPELLKGPVSKGKARKLLVAGAVYLNGRRLRIASKTVIEGAKVDVFIDFEKLAESGPSQDQVFQMSADHILFEDEYLIAVNKPPGLPTQPTLDEARDNLFAALKKFLAQRDHNPQAYVGLHHRLDRDTSGVVLFTKSTEANAGVSELFSKHIAQKTYNAISMSTSSHSISESWKVENYLGKDRESRGKRSKFTEVRTGGDYALTEFRLLEQLQGGNCWIEAKPKTGRTHQIRVHLSEGGLPIVGDPVYGQAQRDGQRLLLHAVSLTFPHPIHKNLISVQSPLPEDFVQCLRRLGSQKIQKSPTKNGSGN